MNDHRTEKIKYYAQSSAADGYDCVILPGSFVGDAFVPPQPVNNAWGASSSSWVIGDEMHLPPDTVYIRYYSTTEDKFYEGQYPLDREEIYRLLTTQYETGGYGSFTVSVAPCGLVGVWLEGSVGSLEVCQFRAREVNLDFAKALRSVYQVEVDKERYISSHREGLYSFIQKEIAENRISSEYWERLSKKYRWKLEINDPGFTVYDYSVDLINMEIYSGIPGGNWLMELNEKAIPKELILYIRHDRDLLRYKVWIEVVKTWDQDDPDDEKQVLAEMNRNRELMDIFDRFYAEAGDEEVSLLVELNESMTAAKLKLKTATKELEIQGCNLWGIFDSDRYNIND